MAARIRRRLQRCRQRARCRELARSLWQNLGVLFPGALCRFRNEGVPFQGFLKEHPTLHTLHFFLRRHGADNLLGTAFGYVWSLLDQLLRHFSLGKRRAVHDFDHLQQMIIQDLELGGFNLLFAAFNFRGRLQRCFCAMQNRPTRVSVALARPRIGMQRARGRHDAASYDWWRTRPQTTQQTQQTGGCGHHCIPHSLALGFRHFLQVSRDKTLYRLLGFV